MKIALLNLPFDNNYGGNLQRYALMKVLQDMGHDVFHINLKRRVFLPWFKKPYSYTKRLFQKYILGKKIYVFQEIVLNREIEKNEKYAEDFYNKHINHSTPCIDIKGVKNVSRDADVIMVGSDQVWRKDMAVSIPFEDYFLRFGKDKKKIAYAVSAGNGVMELSYKELEKFGVLYRQFSGVSVREYQLMNFFQEIGWTTPHSQHVLDPTLLLDPSDYKKMINDTPIQDLTNGKIFCYILDLNDKLRLRIEDKAKELGCEYVIGTINQTDIPVSIEQWLYNIYTAKYIFTDSYHGSVFSMLFHKPFTYCGNVRRGNARIDSLKSLFNIKETENIDYSEFEILRAKYKRISIEFIKQSLENG